MQKPATTKTKMINGSTVAAAADVIVVDVDLEALSCPICHHPLVPPVLQCAAGHLICSACQDELPDMNKCPSCFVNTGYGRYSIPTSYSRCHGVERIVETVRVACPNTIDGCTAGKMLYHEAAEHEKTCARIADSGGLPRRIVKMGPCGSSLGSAGDMDVRGVDRIVKVVVWHSDAVYAISVLCDQEGREKEMETLGKGSVEAGDRRSEICLESDEYLTSLKGYVDCYKGSFCVRSIMFVGNRRTFGPYGEEVGAPFELPAPGGRIVGFHGRSFIYLTALGTYVKMDDPKASARLEVGRKTDDRNSKPKRPRLN